MPTLALIKPDAVAEGYAPAIEAILAEQSSAVLGPAEARPQDVVEIDEAAAPAATAAAAASASTVTTSASATRAT